MNPFTILSCQGGGTLGFGQVLFLTELERKQNALSYRLFNLLAGCSVGSIVTAPLSVGIPASQIKSFFTKSAPLIFHTSVFTPIEEMTGPKYSANALEAGLQALLLIQDATGPRQATLADCKTKLLVPSVDMRTGKPIYFKSYENSSETDDLIVVGPDSGIELWQVCRASSAAQTYFPAYQFGNRFAWDGGNSSANAPDVLSFMEAEQWMTKEQMKMLSLGTGSSPWTLNPLELINPSPIRAALATIELLFAAGVSADVGSAARALGNRHYRVSPTNLSMKIDNASDAALNELSIVWDKLILANQATLEEFTPLS